MATPSRVIRLLHLEDNELDHALVLAHLQRGGLQVRPRRVETAVEFQAALEQAGGRDLVHGPSAAWDLVHGPGAAWDLVISDYHLPGFSGLDALQLLRQHDGQGQVTPFILVSGQIGEDTAVESMRNGAADYLLKNNLSRLAVAVEHALEASDTQRARAQADRDLKASQRRLSELAQHLQTSVEAERHAIAREIHDDVGGALTALKFELDWIRRHTADPELQRRSLSALETVTHAIDSSQRIMQNLRPAILEQGLAAALQWMTSRFEKRTGVECEFRGGADRASQPPLPAGVPLVAYRVAQEALTNISKHAAASRVVLDLSFTGGVLSLEVSDNGCGLSPDDLAKAKSFGIRGLHERAGTVGGWVELSSRAGGGTSLLLSVPLQGADHAQDSDDPETTEWSTLQ